MFAAQGQVIGSDCPPLPSPSQLCVPPSRGQQNCSYNAGDHCCCGQCPQSFTFSCVLDSTSGAGFWHSTLCPTEGCGSEGEWWWSKFFLNSIRLQFQKLRRKKCVEKTKGGGGVVSEEDQKDKPVPKKGIFFSNCIEPF